MPFAFLWRPRAHAGRFCRCVACMRAAGRVRSCAACTSAQRARRLALPSARRGGLAHPALQWRAHRRAPRARADAQSALPLHRWVTQMCRLAAVKNRLLSCAWCANPTRVKSCLWHAATSCCATAALRGCWSAATRALCAACLCLRRAARGSSGLAQRRRISEMRWTPRFARARLLRRLTRMMMKMRRKHCRGL
jgi:hypothetical protein